MAPYYTIFAMLALFSMAENTHEFKKVRLPFFLFSVLVLILFAGLRGADVAGDYGNYVERFDMVPSLRYWLNGEFVYNFRDVLMEPGYIAFGAFIKIFTGDHRWMFLGVAFLSVGIASYNYYKYAPFVFLTLLLFFVHTYFYRDMTQIRSAVAASIGLFLVGQLHKEQHARPLMTIGIAGLFHVASLSLALAYVASYLRLTRRKVFIGLLIAVVLGVVGISSFLLQALPDLGFVTTRLESYFNSKHADSVSLYDVNKHKKFNNNGLCVTVLG